jgi:hypothetical protein
MDIASRIMIDLLCIPAFIISVVCVTNIFLGRGRDVKAIRRSSTDSGSVR